MRIQFAIPTSRSFARPIWARALDAAATSVRTWRARARERAELARMDPRERRDLPFARDFDTRSELNKPFWRE